MRGLIIVCILACVLTGVFYIGGMRIGATAESVVHVAEELPLDVETAAPARHQVIRLVQAPGDVEAVLEVDISSEIVARIEEMAIEEGDVVQRGDLLCRLDDDNLLADVESGEARVGRIEASVQQAEADFEKAERDMQRQVRLSENDATTVMEMSEYRTAVKRAQAVLNMRRQELIETQAILKRVREDLRRTVIKAPIDGVVAALNAKQGEVVVTGTMNNPGTVIMTISDLGRMQVRARIDEIDVPHVATDQKARIYLQAEPDRPVPARVVRVASKGTRVTGRDVVTFETLLEVLSTDSRIKPGMTANVEIEVDHRDEALTVPVEAIVHRLRKDLSKDIVDQFDAFQAELDLSERARQAQYIKVLYVMAGEAAHIRIIETGIADSRRVEVRQGVLDGEQVIVGPYRSLDQLKDGRVVKLIEEESKEGHDSDETSKTPSTASSDPNGKEDDSDGDAG
jgi:HlyD family secretion protein